MGKKQTEKQDETIPTTRLAVTKSKTNSTTPTCKAETRRVQDDKETCRECSQEEARLAEEEEQEEEEEEEEQDDSDLQGRLEVKTINS